MVMRSDGSLSKLSALMAEAPVEILTDHDESAYVAVCTLSDDTLALRSIAAIGGRDEVMWRKLVRPISRSAVELVHLDDAPLMVMSQESCAHVVTRPAYWPETVRWPPEISAFQSWGRSSCHPTELANIIGYRERLRPRRCWTDAFERDTLGTWWALTECGTCRLLRLDGAYDEPRPKIASRDLVKRIRRDQRSLATVILRIEARFFSQIRLRALWLRCILDHVNTALFDAFQSCAEHAQARELVLDEHRRRWSESIRSRSSFH